MNNFWKGLILVLAGFVLWITFSVFGGIEEGISGEKNTTFYSLMFIGFAVMFFAVIVFWFVLPVKNVIRKIRSKHRPEEKHV